MEMPWSIAIFCGIPIAICSNLESLEEQVETLNMALFSNKTLKELTLDIYDSDDFCYLSSLIHDPRVTWIPPVKSKPVTRL